MWEEGGRVSILDLRANNNRIKVRCMFVVSWGSANTGDDRRGLHTVTPTQFVECRCFAAQETITKLYFTSLSLIYLSSEKKIYILSHQSYSKCSFGLTSTDHEQPQCCLLVCYLGGSLFDYRLASAIENERFLNFCSLSM